MAGPMYKFNTHTSDLDVLIDTSVEMCRPVLRGRK